MANHLGHSLVITSFGESHGHAIGVVIDGFPSNFTIDLNHIQSELNRRRPGQSDITTDRNESDAFEIISGVFEGKTTGAPITILIQNKGHQSKDYDALKSVYRPGHADQVYDLKYGHRDHLGGGRSSARITAGWVAAGALAKQFIHQKYGITIQSVVSSVHQISVPDIFSIDWSGAENNAIRCPDTTVATQMLNLISTMKSNGDSVGGIISTRIKNCPTGLGEPIFDKLNAELAKAMFSINAVKGVEFGDGFKGTELKGSEFNSSPNHEGGINGGISTGKDIEFNTAFKPVSSIKIPQKAEDKDGNIVDLVIEGRHDPCVLPRAVPIVEAMSALTIADHLLLHLKYKI